MKDVIPIVITVTVFFLATVVYCSFFEWNLHKHWMHKPWKIPFTKWKVEYPFKAHALTHHVIFRADETYHLIKDEDKWTIPMAWWNGPVLVAVSSTPWIIPSIIVHSVFSISFWVPYTASTVTIALYYVIYEYIHWCMHLPQPKHQRLLERSSLFRKLNGHHLLHHFCQHKNFNVVFPLADFFMGTLITVSKFRFNQPEGPSVPNVQPDGISLPDKKLVGNT